MEVEIYSWQRMLEQRLSVVRTINNNRNQFRSRYIMDPLSQFIYSSIPRVHKLEVLILALTLLRYNDAKRFSLFDFLSGKTQEVRQGKTKEIIEVPPLFLVSSPLTAIEFPAVTLFTDSYDKLRYTLKNSIPDEIRKHLDTQRSLTHIFRFLRTTYYYLIDNDYFKASKYLGHKDEESIKSYVPPELLNYYSSQLTKG